MNSVQIIKEKIDIVQIVLESGVELKQSGSSGRYIGVCPFHEDKKTLFRVEGHEQIFHCFGCGARGDVYSFLMKYHNIRFREVLENLAKRVGEIIAPYTAEDRKEYENKQCYQFFSRTVDFYHNTLFNKIIGEKVLDLLKKDEITREMCIKNKIGYAPDTEKYGYQYLYNKLEPTQQILAIKLGLIISSKSRVYDTFRNCITIPFKNKADQYVGFVAKNLGEKGPRYLLSKESSIFKKDKTTVRFSECVANMLSYDKKSQK